MTLHMRDVVLIVHNVRSCHNVGSLLRTAEGLGVTKVLLTGYTPFPRGAANDTRLPHVAAKIHRQIQKTALGAEASQRWEHYDDITEAVAALRAQGYIVAAIEQAPGALSLPEFRPPNKVALLVGREVEGVEPEVLVLCSQILEIPMFGKKESFNVAQAAAMALFHARFTPA